MKAFIFYISNTIVAVVEIQLQVGVDLFSWVGGGGGGGMGDSIITQSIFMRSTSLGYENF